MDNHQLFPFNSSIVTTVFLLEFSSSLYHFISLQAQPTWQIIRPTTAVPLGLNNSKSNLYRDPAFTLSDFIKSLKVELKSWRKVFWRLWGICHVSVCSLCDKQFQFYMMEFCSFHPGQAEFPNIQFKNSTLPMGEYPCCGEVALRFQPLFQTGAGCKVRDHKLKVRSQRDSEMYRTLITHRDLICVR